MSWRTNGPTATASRNCSSEKSPLTSLSNLTAPSLRASRVKRQTHAHLMYSSLTRSAGRARAIAWRLRKSWPSWLTKDHGDGNGHRRRWHRPRADAASFTTSSNSTLPTPEQHRPLISLVARLVNASCYNRGLKMTVLVVISGYRYGKVESIKSKLKIPKICPKETMKNLGRITPTTGQRNRLHHLRQRKINKRGFLKLDLFDACRL